MNWYSLSCTERNKIIGAEAIFVVLEELETLIRELLGGSKTVYSAAVLLAVVCVGESSAVSLKLENHMREFSCRLCWARSDVRC